VNDEEEARAQLRREQWRVEPLSDRPPAAPESLHERALQLEQMRRVAFAIAGVPYPEGPTPREARLRWPVERIGADPSATIIAPTHDPPRADDPVMVVAAGRVAID